MNVSLSSNHSAKSRLGWINHLDKLSAFETEKRRYPRYRSGEEVTCTFYDSLKDDFEIVDAKVKNKSEGGLLLKTDRPLEIGMPVLIRLKTFSDENVKDELKDGIHTHVVRCNELFVPGRKPCYNIATEHFEWDD